MIAKIIIIHLYCRYNPTKVKYINDLLTISSLLFLEELWLSDKQMSELSTHFPGYTCNVHGVSAIMYYSIITR